MKSSQLKSVFALTICVGVIGGSWFKVWGQQPTISQSAPRMPYIALTSTEVEKILRDEHLSSLLQRIEGSQMRFPSIPTEGNCNRFPLQNQSDCLAEASLGPQLYASLREYQSTMQAMSLSDFSTAIHRLSVLRETLLSGNSLGNIFLADLTNRIIYWNLALRAVVSSSDEMAQIDRLTQNYRDLVSDWRTVAKAVEKEAGFQFSYTNLDPTFKSQNPDDYARQREYKILLKQGKELNAQYANLFDQLATKVSIEPTPDNENTYIRTIPQMLKNGVGEQLIITRAEQGCERSIRPQILKYWVEFLTKVKNSTHISKTTKLLSPYDKKGLEHVSNLTERVPTLFPMLMSKLSKETIGSCKIKITWKDFSRVSEGVENLDAFLRSNKLAADDESFEMVYY